MSRHGAAVGPVPIQVVADRVVRGRAAEELPATEHRMLLPQATETRGEVDQVAAVGDGVPVEPGQLVVLTVGVVVAALAAPELITAEKQWDALGQQQGGE